LGSLVSLYQSRGEMKTIVCKSILSNTINLLVRQAGFKSRNLYFFQVLFSPFYTNNKL
jgi:hypothetical protein